MQPPRSSAVSQIDVLTRAAARAQWPIMVTHLVYAVLAIVLAAMGVLAFAAISKIEEPHR